MDVSKQDGAPEPADEHVRARFRSQKVRGTKPELDIRRLVHAAGLRFRVDARPEEDMRVRADLLFTRARVAVFIDGCFWHGCPQHFVAPKNNAEWWAEKIGCNQLRDRQSRILMGTRGWEVMSFWEHHDSSAAAAQIISTVAKLSTRANS